MIGFISDDWSKQEAPTSIVSTDLDLLNLKVVCSDIKTKRFFYMLPKSILKVKKVDIDDYSLRDKKKRQREEKVDNEVREKTPKVRNNNLKGDLKLRQYSKEN